VDNKIILHWTLCWRTLKVPLFRITYSNLKYNNRRKTGSNIPLCSGRPYYWPFELWKIARTMATDAPDDPDDNKIWYYYIILYWNLYGYNNNISSCIQCDDATIIICRVVKVRLSAYAYIITLGEEGVV